MDEIMHMIDSYSMGDAVWAAKLAQAVGQYTAQAVKEAENSIRLKAAAQIANVEQRHTVELHEAEVASRIDELNAIVTHKNREYNEQEGMYHCENCAMILETETDKCACDYLTQNRIAALKREQEGESQ